MVLVMFGRKVQGTLKYTKKGTLKALSQQRNAGFSPSNADSAHYRAVKLESAQEARLSEREQNEARRTASSDKQPIRKSMQTLENATDNQLLKGVIAWAIAHPRTALFFAFIIFSLIF